jgi:hypothetical protein
MLRAVVIAFAIYGGLMLLYHLFRTLRTAFGGSVGPVALPVIPKTPKPSRTLRGAGSGAYRADAIVVQPPPNQGQARIDAIVPQRLELRQGYNLTTSDMGPDYTATFFSP